MATSLWLRQVQLLTGPEEPLLNTDVLIGADGALLAWGEAAAARAADLDMPPTHAGGWLLAPALVDPHSVLEQPLSLQHENLQSLAQAAAAGGYGTVALLPWARPWRDRPERLGGLHWPEPLQLHLWGSFSLDGEDRELAPHLEQREAGAIGLAGSENLPPLPLLERGLLLGEMAKQPVLIAPRQADLCGGGFVREGVETLRAGWPPDPAVSESLPLAAVLELARCRPDRRLVLMNLSTAGGVSLLRDEAERQRRENATGSTSLAGATVCWWHLLADSGSLDPAQEGWRLVPSLGSPSDREALVVGLEEGLITAVAVHHLSLDPEEQLLPLDQRRGGLAGHGPVHGLVLPLLWQELVRRRGWSADQLWQVLCWGPAGLLSRPAPRLQPGSRQWLLFDPETPWRFQAVTSLSLAANLPVREGCSIRGMVRASGLSAPDRWRLPAPGCPSD